jgi:uncharacterized peroxidase-related enzyme
MALKEPADFTTTTSHKGNLAMARINPVSWNANSKTRELFESVEKKWGMTPNIVTTMAQSPAVARAYVEGSEILAGGSLSNALREQIALTVSEFDQCDYCVSAHSFYGSKAGLNETDLLDARHGTSSNAKANAALTFTRKIVENRGHVTDDDVEEVRRAGYTNGEIAEIVAIVGMTTFTNYFNLVAGTEVDFPVVPLLATV